MTGVSEHHGEEEGEGDDGEGCYGGEGREEGGWGGGTNTHR